MLRNIKAVIFDLDGTLVDSMWVWEKIDIDYLALRGFKVPQDLRDAIAHLSFDETAIYFKERFNIQDSIDKIKEDWNNMAVNEYANNVKLKPGVIEFLKLLKLSGIKIALATSNSLMLLELALKNNNIYDYFDAITTTNEVSYGKDHPDVYLLAAKKLNIEPQYCLVFEDILAAVMGAKAAGMNVVGVKDNAASHQWTAISESADRFIEDFNELIVG